MDYIQLLQKRINGINDNVISGLLFDEFFNMESKILELQRLQISKHEGFDDQTLHSGLYKGVYAKSTQSFADMGKPSLTSKPAGGKYNFVWTGDFMGNMRMKRQNKGLELYSTGTGTGDKKDFFESYDNMFGLNTENTATVNSEVLYYVYEKLLTRIYL